MHGEQFQDASTPYFFVNPCTPLDEGASWVFRSSGVQMSHKKFGRRHEDSDGVATFDGNVGHDVCERGTTQTEIREIRLCQWSVNLRYTSSGYQDVPRTTTIACNTLWDTSCPLSSSPSSTTFLPTMFEVTNSFAARPTLHEVGGMMGAAWDWRRFRKAICSITIRRV